MDVTKIKLDLIDKLRESDYFIRDVDGVEYLFECPYCNDSKKFYVKINPNDNYRIVCHCFKCDEPEHGIFDKETLELLGIDDEELVNGVEYLNKNFDKVDGKNFTSTYEKGKSTTINFDYQLPEITESFKTKYIEDRLGVKFNKEDFTNMKLITSIEDFLNLNDIEDRFYSGNLMKIIEKDFIGFLSMGNSHILLRNTKDDLYGKALRWIKYPINKKSKDNKIFYAMSSSVDLFTSEKITINISEGVFDILSVYYNIDKDNFNSLYFVVTGHYYGQLLLYLLDLGLVGSNIVINIYADNDEQYNKDAKQKTTLEYFKRELYLYKHLYKEVNIIYNLKGKDFGVPITEISMKKYKL